MALLGYGRTRKQVYSTVKVVLDAEGRTVPVFHNNRPGREWLYCFLRCHPDLKEKKAELIQLSRASACAPEVIEAWYKDFDKMLKENNITSPSQIFNCDDSGFPLQTGPTGSYLRSSSVSHAYQVTANNRTQITNVQPSFFQGGDLFWCTL